jgi:hypothetical protein
LFEFEIGINTSNEDDGMGYELRILEEWIDQESITK